MKHLNIRVFGLVQGVFFRHSAQMKAEKLGVKGFARNEPDGPVYVEAEGDEEALEKFVEWAQNGPDSARVKKVDVNDGELKNFEKFEIK